MSEIKDKKKNILPSDYIVELKNRVHKEFPFKTIDGDITMAQVFYEYMFEKDENGKNIGIFRDDFKQETVELYTSYICDLILPRLQTKGLNQLVAEDFDEILDKIQLDTGFSESTMSHLCLQVWRICQAGYRHGHCDDILWGTRYYRGAQKVEEDTQSLSTVPRRAFDPETEDAIMSFLMDEWNSDVGQNVGLAIMALTGMRNNEICGLSIGDFRLLGRNSSTKVLWVYKSVKINSRETRPSGKTRNANRVLPLIDRLATFIEQRIVFLQEKIDDGTLPQDTKIKELPLACYKTDYTRRCSSRDLTLAGRRLFKELNVSQRDMAQVSAWVYRAYRAKLIEEKDATTYTFRRNFGTHIKNLGFSVAEIQYYMGHDMSTSHVTRADLSLAENLEKMKAILNYYPARMPHKDDPIPKSMVVDGYSQTNPRDRAHQFHIIADEEYVTYLIKVDATAAVDDIKLHIKSNSPFDIEVITLE